MRKVFVLLLAFCFVLFFSIQAQAQVRKPGFGLGFRAGAQKLADADLEGGVEAEFDTAVVTGITGTININEFVSLEAAVDHGFDRDVDMSAMGASAQFGEFSQTSLTLALQAHVPTRSAFSPYFGGGVGYFWNSFDLDPIVSLVIPGARAEVDDDLGWFLNAGFEILMGKNAALCFDFRYTWLTTDITSSATGMTSFTEEIDLNGLTGTVGFKYYF